MSFPTTRRILRRLLTIGVNFIVGISVISLLLILIAFFPFILGIKTLIKRHLVPDKIIKNENLADNESHYEKNYYEYRETTSPSQKIKHASMLCLKILFFPFYFWAVGVKRLIGYLAHPISNRTKISKNDALFSRNSCLSQCSSLKSKIAEKIHYRTLTVSMPDGRRLHTRELWSGKKEPTTDKPHIIYFCCNDASYEDYLDQMKRQAANLHAKVIGFHNSSFGRSGRLLSDGSIGLVPSTSKTTLVEEGIAQVQRLVDAGVNHITLYGHSLGAGIATLVAWHFHKKGIPINIYNDRSFSSITKFLEESLLSYKNARMKGNSGGALHNFQHLGVSLLRPIIKLVLICADWEIDAGSVFRKIPKKNRGYIEAWTASEDGDGMVPAAASLSSSFKKHSARNCDDYSASSSGEKVFSCVSTQAHQSGNKELLQHSSPLRQMRNRKGSTGEEVFSDFVSNAPSVLERSLNHSQVPDEESDASSTATTFVLAESNSTKSTEKSVNGLVAGENDAVRSLSSFSSSSCS